ncbi:MAG: hypothetical protein L7S48_02815 [Candidatus Poseidonia sp.]|nr:hypothetical protein [Poseidonia sp.]
MRSIGLILLMVLPLLCPPSIAEMASQGRDQETMGVTAQENVIVHQNETVSAYITLHNKASINQEFTISPLSFPAMLSPVNLPLTETLVPNHLNQFVFGIKATTTASFATYQIQLSITSDFDAEINHTVTMNVTVAPYSNLNFGVDGVTALTVDENVRTSVAVNLSNNGTYPDNVTYSLYTQSNWNWGWIMENQQGGNAYTVLSPSTLVYVYLWVDIPAVENGMPLLQTGPRFTLTATSSLDDATTSWSFDLLMNEKKNATIDDVEGDITLAPDEDGRIDVVVRNVGNSPNTLNISLQGVDAAGNPLPDLQPADRFNVSGWTVALFGGLEDVELLPNESRTIQIGIQSPNRFSGDISVQVLVFADGAMLNTRSAQVNATIQRISAGNLTYSQTGCDAILPNQSCDASVEVSNTGNSYNSYALRTGAVTDGFTVVLPSEVLLVQPSQTKTYPPLQIFAEEQATAFLLGSATIELLDDSGMVVNSLEIPLKVAPEIKWTFRNVEEQVNAKGRLSIAMEVRNDGNAVDGLLVQLQSSHSTPMGFIPPDSAIYEDGVEFPRSFEINDIPLGANFTIRAWVELPQDQNTNGTVFINTSIRSRFAPELPFVHTSEGEYLGVTWQPSEEVDEGFNWSSAFETTLAYVKAWAFVVMSVMVAGVIIYKAVIDRERRMNEEAILPYQQISGDAHDWIEKFRGNDSNSAQPTSSATSALTGNTYENVEQMQVQNAPSPRAPPIEPRLVEAASLILGRGIEEQREELKPSLNTNQPQASVPLPLPQPKQEVVKSTEASSQQGQPDDLEF